MVRKKSAKVGGPSAAESERQIAGFIQKFEAKNAKLIRAVRRAVRRRFPSANELVYDNYNFFVIAYGLTERPSDCVFSIAAAANGVGLHFSAGASLPDPHKLLQGGGKRNRFIRIESADALARPAVGDLMDAAVAKMGVSGKGKVIIRSVSKKQRLRR